MQLIPLTTVVSILVGAPSQSVGLIEAWYHEYMLGDAPAAASMYEQIFLEGSSSAEADRAEKGARRLAALRSGLCFERIGRPDQAVNLYRWIGRQEQLDDRGDEVAASAARRLHILHQENFIDDSPRLAGDLEKALQELVDSATRRIARTKLEIDNLQHEVDVWLQRLASIKALRARLAKVGLSLSLGSADRSAMALGRDASVLDGDGGWGREEVQAAMQMLSADLLRGLKEAIVQEIELEGLRLLVAGVPDEAARAFRLALLADPTNENVRVYVKAVRDPRLLDGPLVAKARRWLFMRYERLLTNLVRDVQEVIRAADQAQRERGRSDVALRELMRGRAMLDWALPALRAEREVRDLSAQMRRRMLLFTQGAEAGTLISRFWSHRRRQIQSAKRAGRELLGAVSSYLAFRQPHTVAEAEQELEPRRQFPESLAVPLDLAAPVKRPGGSTTSAHALAVQEVQRLLAETRRSLRQAEVENARSRAEEVLLLLEWIPSIDPRGFYRDTAMALKTNAIELDSGRRRPELDKNEDKQSSRAAKPSTKSRAKGGDE